MIHLGPLILCTLIGVLGFALSLATSPWVYSVNPKYVPYEDRGFQTFSLLHSLRTLHHPSAFAKTMQTSSCPLGPIHIALPQVSQEDAVWCSVPAMFAFLHFAACFTLFLFHQLRYTIWRRFCFCFGMSVVLQMVQSFVTQFPIPCGVPPPTSDATTFHGRSNAFYVSYATQFTLLTLFVHVYIGRSRVVYGVGSSSSSRSLTPNLAAATTGSTVGPAAAWLPLIIVGAVWIGSMAGMVLVLKARVLYTVDLMCGVAPPVLVFSLYHWFARSDAAVAKRWWVFWLERDVLVVPSSSTSTHSSVAPAAVTPVLVSSPSLSTALSHHHHTEASTTRRGEGGMGPSPSPPPATVLTNRSHPEGVVAVSCGSGVPSPALGPRSVSPAPPPPTPLTVTAPPPHSDKPTTTGGGASGLPRRLQPGSQWVALSLIPFAEKRTLFVVDQPTNGSATSSSTSSVVTSSSFYVFGPEQVFAATDGRGPSLATLQARSTVPWRVAMEVEARHRHEQQEAGPAGLRNGVDDDGDVVDLSATQVDRMAHSAQATIDVEDDRGMQLVAELVQRAACDQQRQEEGGEEDVESSSPSSPPSSRRNNKHKSFSLDRIAPTLMWAFSSEGPIWVPSAVTVTIGSAIGWLNLLSVAVGDRNRPLHTPLPPDVLHDWFDPLPSHAADVFLYPIVVAAFGFTFFSRFRWTILSRTGIVYGCCMIPRMATIPSTFLPDASPSCAERQHAPEVTCGDMVYSGHTVGFLMCALLIRYYTQEWWWETAAWLVTAGGLTCVVVSRLHYTRDVVTALLVIATMNHLCRVWLFKRVSSVREEAWLWWLDRGYYHVLAKEASAVEAAMVHERTESGDMRES